MLVVENVSRSFGGRKALDDISFEVNDGRLTGFVGGNGAGKTTTMRIILGVLSSDAGRVTLAGRPLSPADRTLFGYMPEERGLYPKMKVAEQITYLGRLHGMSTAAAKASTDSLLERLGLTERAGATVESLSLGNQQRAQIAAALVHDPEVLILDEPFSGLDPIAVDTVQSVLTDYAAGGAPVLFSSHQLDIVERICDDLVVIAGGQIKASGSKEKLQNEHSGPRYEIELASDAGWLRDVAGITVVDFDGGYALFEVDRPAGSADAAASDASRADALRADASRADAASDASRADALRADALRADAASAEMVAQTVLTQALARGAVRSFRPARASLAQIFRRSSSDNDRTATPHGRTRPDRRAPRTATARFTAPSFAQASWLVARREVTMRLRSKAFLISTGILMLAVLASILIGGFIGASPSSPKVSVVAGSPVAAQVQAIAGLDVRVADSVVAAEALVRDKTVDAAILPATGTAADASPYSVVALDAAPTDVVSLLSSSPSVQLLEPAGQSPLIIYFVALAFGLVFFMSAVTFGGSIAQSVVEEKQTRVVEILISSIPIRALLAGKVLGNSLLAFSQIAGIAIVAGVGLIITGQSALLATLGPSIIWFVVFFLFGFVLLASMFAASAALVSRQEDIGSVTSPVTMLVMVPYILVLVFNDNPLVLGIMSYVPFAAPVGMPMRLFLGTAQWWEPLVSLAVLVVVTFGVITIGSRIYSNSLLRTGSRVKLLEALKG